MNDDDRQALLYEIEAIEGFLKSARWHLSKARVALVQADARRVVTRAVELVAVAAAVQATERGIE